MIPFMGIGTMGEMAINNLPSDIRNEVFTVFFLRENTHRKVCADLTVQYGYDNINKTINDSNIIHFVSFLKNNNNKVFIVVNLGGDAASECAIKTINILKKANKKAVIHVSTPFHFQSNMVKKKAQDSIKKLKLPNSEVFVGNNGDILRECGQGVLFSEFLSYRSNIIYNDFRKTFGLKNIKYNDPTVSHSKYAIFTLKIPLLFKRTKKSNSNH